MRGRERSQLRTEALRRRTSKLFSAQGLGCSVAAKTCGCLTTSCICLFAKTPFYCCCWCCFISFCFPATTSHTNISSISDKAMHSIPSSSEQVIATLLKKMGEHCMTEEKKKEQARSLQQKCEKAVCVCVCMPALLLHRLAFVRAQSSDAICSFLLLTMQCRFEATGPIWGLLSSG